MPTPDTMCIANKPFYVHIEKTAAFIIVDSYTILAMLLSHFQQGIY